MTDAGAGTAGGGGTGAGGSARGTVPGGGSHGTEYEDAIARRIALLEDAARPLREELAREEARRVGLEDANARLQQLVEASRLRLRSRGRALVALVAVALLLAAALAFVLLAGKPFPEGLSF